uniref:Uncharacterized protein n=1 Tax=Klebsiella pneumoniae TaxID=573 RepID=A0A8B0SZL1_KLEPN|nr:hypothetical protein [Klebsiella pneumoniae]
MWLWEVVDSMPTTKSRHKLRPIHQVSLQPELLPVAWIVSEV